MARLYTAGKWYGGCVSKNMDAAALTGAAVPIFQIENGPIRILNLGIWVSTAIPSGGNTVKFRFTPVGGSIADISSTVETASAALNQLFMLDGVPGTALITTTAVGMQTGAQGEANHLKDIVLVAGMIYADFSAGPPATGAIQVFMEYKPLSNLTRVSVQSGAS